VNGRQGQPRPPLRLIPAPVDAVPVEVVAVLESGGTTCIVRCPYCRKTHVHGVRDASSYGLRDSHCWDRESRSYVLVPEPRAVS